MTLVIFSSNPSRLEGQRGAGNQGGHLQLEDQMLRDLSRNFAVLKKIKNKKTGKLSVLSYLVSFMMTLKA